MQHKIAEKDILESFDTSPWESRRKLIPVWIHLVMAVLLAAEIYTIGNSWYSAWRLSENNADQLKAYVIFNILFNLLLTVKIAGYVLIWYHWRKAIHFAATVSVIMSAIAIVLALTSLISSSEIIATVLIWAFCILQLAFLVWLFRIKRHWKFRPGR